MRLKDYFEADRALAGVACPDKDSLLAMLAAWVADRFPELDPAELRARLASREAESSTGIGEGVAVPHATVDELEQTIGVLVQLPEGVAFAAIDGQPVYVVFMLLGPPTHVGVHLKLLARIARLVRRSEFIAALRQASGSEVLYDRLVREDEQRTD